MQTSKLAYHFYRQEYQSTRAGVAVRQPNGARVISIPLGAEREVVERIEHEAETASKPGGDGRALCAGGLTRCRGLPGQGVGWRSIRRETKGVRR
ncbi:hypothetical protein MGN70_005030 [Eutypa lata]|nr:hypothetical protein MGN70_005030 [Eutypa lata]